MLGMAAVFIVIGLLIGLGSGFYYLNLIDKKLKIYRQEGLLKRDIISVIQKGENDLVEYKSSIHYDYYKRDINTNLEIEILKTIAGFMNSKGGRLIIGVSDDGEILGLDNDYHFLRNKNKDGFELKLFQMISNEIGPEFCSFFQVFFYSIEEKEICVIEIQKSRLPVYVKQNKNTAFYLRVGNSSKKLSVKEAVNYLNIRHSN